MIKYNICISGAASGETVDEACAKAYQVGAAIAKAGHITTSGATVGLPYFGARGAHEAGGQSIGFSPAVSLREHVRKYRLPVGVYSYVNFTGMNYVGRDIFLVQSSDAIISVGGRMGSLHEFTTAIENRKPCGVLLGSGGLADYIPILLEELKELGEQAKRYVVYDDDPDKLVAKVVKMLEEDNSDLSPAELKKYEATFDALVCDPDGKHKAKTNHSSTDRAG